MALGTYTELQASIADWLHRSDLTATIPDFIALAESRISRDLRLRAQLTATTLSTVADTQTVALPSDFLEIENISCTSGGMDRSMEFVTLERLNLSYPDGSGNGIPSVYSVVGSNLYLGRVPDAVYSLPFGYYAKFAALSVTPTNWLLTNHPGVYLFGALAESGDYTQSDQIAKWEGKYSALVQALQLADEKAKFSGAALRVRGK